MDAHLGLDLEPRRQHWKAFDEAPRKSAITGKNVAEIAPKQTRKQAGEQPVSKHMAAAISMLGFVPASADDHVELFGDQQIDHPRCGSRIVSEVAIRHHVNVGVD